MITDQIEVSKEIELILCCARSQPDRDTKKRISNILEELIDWNLVLSLAFYHRMPMLLLSNLMSTSLDKIPPEIISRLQASYHFNSARNLFLTEELLRIIDLFEDHEIPIVPYKGPTLAIQAYGDLTLRSFGDLDIMVHKGNVLKAKDLLTSKGYEQSNRFTPHQEKILRARNFNLRDYDLEFRKKDNRTFIELHWRFFEDFFSVPFDESVWSRLESLMLEGRDIRSFSPDDLILYLCTHSTKHRWNQFSMVSDLAGIIEKQEIDWDFVDRKAIQMGLKSILHTGLLLSNSLLETKIPSQMMNEAARDNRAQKLVLEILRGLLEKKPSQQKSLGMDLFWPKARERAGDRFRYFFGYATEPSLVDYDFIHLPETLYPLYLLVRPIRLIQKHRGKSRSKNL
jgi:hypothetical protein